MWRDSEAVTASSLPTVRHLEHSEPAGLCGLWGLSARLLDPAGIGYICHSDRGGVGADSCLLAASAGQDPAAGAGVHRASNGPGSSDFCGDAHSHSGSIWYSLGNPHPYRDTDTQPDVHTDLDSDTDSLPYAHQ